MYSVTALNARQFSDKDTEVGQWRKFRLWPSLSMAGTNDLARRASTLPRDARFIFAATLEWVKLPATT
jgi:hypothetical protein